MSWTVRRATRLVARVSYVWPTVGDVSSSISEGTDRGRKDYRIDAEAPWDRVLLQTGC
jgi:hypothetical protein